MKFRKSILAVAIASVTPALWATDCESGQVCEAEERGAIEHASRVLSRPNTVGEGLAPLPSQSERELPREYLMLWQRPGSDTLTVEVLNTVEQVTAAQFEGNTDFIRFESGRPDLSGEYVTMLGEVIERLRDKLNLRFRITGHTDPQRLSSTSVAIFGDNYGLGMARAREVGQALQTALGLSDDRFEYLTRGSDVPLAAGDSADAWALNRRVEVEIWYDEVSQQLVSSTETRPAPLCPDGMVPAADNTPFRISIDGQPALGTLPGSADAQRCVDVALTQDRLQLTYDNQSAMPRLDVTTAPRVANVGQPQRFQGDSNYLHWIDRAEIIIFGHSRLWQSAREIATVPLDPLLRGEWTPASDMPENVFYRLRVYDKGGRFDETSDLPLRIARGELRDSEDEADADLAAIWGSNKLQRHTIPVSGGTITVNGKDVQQGHDVFVMGYPVPVDQNGAFAIQQIVPRGLHRVEVAVVDEQGTGTAYRRDLRLPRRDWFTVAIADLTVGQQNTSGPATLMTGEERYYDDKLYVDGRIALYSKGNVTDSVVMTTSVDTGQMPVKSLFSNFNDKNPREFLRRIDPSRSWGTFGDDSLLVEDAPTRGKMYLKLEDQRSHLVWGNFNQIINDTELAQVDRRLYGLQGVTQSDRFTAFGERQIQVEGFAAEPGTSFAREEFQGTGGSLFFLRHQDITAGSESVRVEVRDRDSGLVIDSQYLTYGLDYEIDSIQGRILLTRPLSGISDNAGLVRSGGSLSGNPVYLIVSYEHSPGFERVNDLVMGGRASAWLNDSVRLGITGSSQEMGLDQQDLLGVDVMLRRSDYSWLSIEQAQTDGFGFGHHTSFDGGFGFAGTSVMADDAKAQRVAGAFTLADWGYASDASGTFYYEDRDMGFSAPGRMTLRDTRQIGGAFNTPVGERSELLLKVDDMSERDGQELRSVEVALANQLTETLRLTTGFRTDDRQTLGGQDDGGRDDLALQLGYKPLDADWSAYVFGQGTLNRDGNRSRNNRLGVGGSYRVTERVGLMGEISEGDLGFGAQAGIDYAQSDRTNVYLNYLLDTDRTGFGMMDSRNGQLVTGARSQFTDRTKLYTEQRYQHGAQMTGLIQAYGLDFAATDAWSFGLTTEHGRLQSETVAEIKRSAVSGSAAYAGEDARYAGLLEYRRDKTINDTRDVWLTRNSLSYQQSDDWRVLGQFDLARSESSLGSFFDGNFTEASLAYAYRPVVNDRLNMLFKYSYLEDLAPPDQLSVTGRRVDFSQRSHVLAADALYDLTARWSIGGRLALREGELRPSRDSSAPWFTSRGTLAAARVDWHVVSQWDLMAEVRVRRESMAKDSRKGALLGVYRHVGNHLKAGVGYNFSDFSDDLTDMSFRSQGWFFNLVGKF